MAKHRDAEKHSQRWIRYGAREMLAAIPKWATSGHLRRCSDVDTDIKSLSSDKHPYKKSNSLRYDMVLVSSTSHPNLLEPHYQVTYDVVATPIGPKNA
eukprot:scaffold7208_cov127-Skeletonema_dohrnii-CCMP3373.AAC.3